MFEVFVAAHRIANPGKCCPRSPPLLQLHCACLAAHSFSGRTDEQLSIHYITKLANLLSACLYLTEAGRYLDCRCFASAFCAENSLVRFCTQLFASIHFSISRSNQGRVLSRVWQIVLRATLAVQACSKRSCFGG